MLLGRAMGMRLGDRAVFALSGTFSNGVGIGIPFITYAFGEAGLVPLLMIISLNSLILLTLSAFVLEIDGQGGARGRLLGKLGGAVLTMLKHPDHPVDLRRAHLVGADRPRAGPRHAGRDRPRPAGAGRGGAALRADHGRRLARPCRAEGALADGGDRDRLQARACCR